MYAMHVCQCRTRMCVHMQWMVCDPDVLWFQCAVAVRAVACMQAADRHIPACANTINKPKFLKGGSESPACAMHGINMHGINMHQQWLRRHCLQWLRRHCLPA